MRYRLKYKKWSVSCVNSVGKESGRYPDSCYVIIIETFVTYGFCTIYSGNVVKLEYFRISIIFFLQRLLILCFFFFIYHIIISAPQLIFELAVTKYL